MIKKNWRAAGLEPTTLNTDPSGETNSIQVSLTPAAQCRAGFEPCDEQRLAKQKLPILTAQTTQPIQKRKKYGLIAHAL